MEDMAANLRNYELQLSQVESALTSDPDNAELLELKIELEQAIELTKGLMGDAASGPQAVEETTYQFRAGDPCMAPWSEDGFWYEAKVEDITSDGQCTVTFTGLGKGRGRISEVCLVSLLKPIGGKRKFKPAAAPQSAGTSNSSDGSEMNQSKKPKVDSKLEVLKKKKKREQRMEKLKAKEEEQEKVKNSWQQFAQKASSKHLKGATKKSIFASPDTVSGKVGVGTCGIGGKGMTEVGEHAASKHWKKEKPISGPDFGASASFASFMSKLPGSSFPSTSKKY